MKKRKDDKHREMSAELRALADKLDAGLDPREFFDDIMVLTAASVATLASYNDEIDLPRWMGDALCATALEMMAKDLKTAR
ncbi:MAG: hypothetical protein PHY29_02800 [Syntrophales bacterium]|nr:hypothetical protein [Syntrophales bacterium]